MAYFDYYDIDTITSFETYNIRTCYITSSRFVVCYTDPSTNYTYADIYEISGETITPILQGELIKTGLRTGAADCYDIAKVRDNMWVLVYVTSTQFGYISCYYNGLTVDTLTDILDSNSANWHAPSCCRVSEDKIVGSASNLAGYSRLICFEYNGFSWSKGVISGMSNNASWGRLTSIGTDKFLFVRHNTGTSAGEVYIGTVSGTTITRGDVCLLDGTEDIQYMSCCEMGADKAVVCTRSPEGTSDSKAYAITVNDLVPTIGNAFTFNDTAGYPTACYALNDGIHFVVVYAETTPEEKGRIQLCNVDWDTQVITSVLGEQTFWDYRATGFGDMGLDLELDANNNMVIAFQDDNDSNDIAKVIYGAVFLVPPPPTGISVEEGEGQNTINFTSGGETVNIYWANSPGVTKETGTKISDVTSPYIHDDLNPSLTYYYILTAENESGEGDASSEYSGSPYPEAPINVDIVEGAGNNTISWDSVTGADSYNIYWANSPGVTKGTGTKITGVTSPYLHSSLIPGQPYYYVVTAEDEDGESSESSEVNGTPYLGIPGNINVHLSGSLEITVSWDSVIGADLYNIYWLKSPGVTKETGNKITDVTSPYIHDSLDDGDTYYYVVTAENEFEESDESEEDSALSGDVADPPSVVSAIATDIQEITLSWSDVLSADSYNIYYATIHGVNKEIGVQIEDVTSPYIFNAPIPDINYYFVVTTIIDVLGESDESGEVYALSLPPIPDVPVSVVATAGDASVILTWSPPSYADSFNIYWGLAPGVTKETGTKIEGVTSPYTFVVPTLYQAYYFVVTAVNESGEGDESAEVFATPDPVIPDPPENLSGEGTATREITLIWDAADYAVTYNIYYGRLPNVTKTNSSKITGVADVTKAINNLIYGRTYYFAVSSVNPEGESGLSEEISVVALIDLTGTSVSYLKATSEYNTVILEWSSLIGATSYNIYWSKTSPVDTSTANKIENVTSPYRHYITLAEDPIYIVVGNNDLGESDPSEEADATPKEITFNSINFLPENSREYPLFVEFCSILDYVVSKYHYENVDKLAGLFDAVHDDFDPDYILGLIGAEYFFNFDLDEDQKKALCLMLSNLYDMKGTKKGLDYILRLLDLDATVYEWYNINQGLYPEIPETVDPCSIVLDLGLGDHPLLEEEEVKFTELANYLLWVCVKLHGIFWSKKFEDWFEGIEDEISEIDIDNDAYNKFCAWEYNYPDLIIIGSAVLPHPVFIGESGLTIGDFYFEGEPLVIGSDADEGANYDGVCDPHFIGEPGYYIGGGEEDEGLSQLVWEIDET